MNRGIKIACLIFYDGGWQNLLIQRTFVPPANVLAWKEKKHKTKQL